MLRAVVQHSGSHISVNLVAAESGEEVNVEECEFKEQKEGVTVCGEGPSPIMPELKELAWTGGSFVVFAVLMRYVLYPRLRKGMDARYQGINAAHDGADNALNAAKAEVVDFQAQMAGAKSEAAARVDVVRQQLEAERASKLAEVNAVIAAKREAATADVAASRAAVSDQVEAAVASVAARAAQLAIGKAPAADAVTSAVRSVMSVGAAR